MPKLSREEFEKWAKSPRADGDFLDCVFTPGVNGYADPYTDYFWECAKFFYAAASGEALLCQQVEQLCGDVKAVQRDYHNAVTLLRRVSRDYHQNRNMKGIVLDIDNLLAAPHSRPSTEGK